MKAKYKRKKVNGRSIDEHRLVMELHIGRKLDKNEIVHHIDGDRFNNDISNLRIMSVKEHSVVHNQKYPITKCCEICGNEFTPLPTKRKRQKTCSRKCSEKLRLSKIPRKVALSQRSEIINLLNDGISGVVIAEKYGITPQAVNYIKHRSTGCLSNI